MKRIFILMLTVISVAATFGKGEPYSDKTEQKAVRAAFNLLKVYYPDNSLCVSDSTFVLDMIWPDYSRHQDVVDSITLQEIKSHPYELDFTPIYCKGLADVFAEEICNDTCGYSYEVQFTAPYKNMMRCDVMPIDRRIGILGAPTIESFLFKYDKDGIITLLIRSVVHID